MLRPRLIPCLLVRNGGLVKTRRFTDSKYVGDPINAVRIFNEKRVDELMVVDIDATVRGSEPNYAMIAHLAAECRMPLCYGGGVTTVDQVRRIVGLGVEKVAIGHAAVKTPALVSQAAEQVGSQSVVVVADVKKTGLLRRYEVVTHNGSRATGLDPATFARSCEVAGAGEIVINAVDADGEMTGYDRELMRTVVETTTIPVTALGGAGTIEHVRDVFAIDGVTGAAAGSMFVFKGKYRAVLISYPSPGDR